MILLEFVRYPEDDYSFYDILISITVAILAIMFFSGLILIGEYMLEEEEKRKKKVKINDKD